MKNILYGRVVYKVTECQFKELTKLSESSKIREYLDKNIGKFKKVVVINFDIQP